MSPLQQLRRKPTLSSSSTSSSSSYDEFFRSPDEVEIIGNMMNIEKEHQAQPTIQQEMSSSLTQDRRHRRQRNRHRSVTLLPGTRYHDVFFSSDDSVRERFDEQTEYAKCATRRDLSFSRQDSTYSSSSSTSSASALKSGRPFIPRYGSF